MKNKVVIILIFVLTLIGIYLIFTPMGYLRFTKLTGVLIQEGLTLSMKMKSQ